MCGVRDLAGGLMTPEQVRAQLAAHDDTADAPTPYALTAEAVALHLTRQRETPCSEPGFIAAYLDHEHAKEIGDE